MSRKDAPEFSFDEKTQLYRKRIKNHEGRWVPVYGKTKPELREKIKLKESEFEQLATLQTNPYCYQYAKTWFAIWSAGKSAKVQENTRSALNNYILPAVGTKHIAEVTEDDLQLMLSGISNKSQSLNSKVLRIAKQLFKAAKKEGLIFEDPAIDLKPGGKKTAKKESLTEAQQQTLLDTMSGTNIYTFILIALHSGLRREEVLGLQWDCVHLDVEHPYIAVRRAVRWEVNQPIVSNELKSAAARRDIPITSELTEHLKAEKEKSTGDFVIGGEKPLTQTCFRRRWEQIAARSTGTKTVIDKKGNKTTVEKKLGDKIRNHKIYITIDFDVTPHQLRHTYITRLILAGVNIKVVQYLAGHATVDITLNIYTHLMENRPQDTAAAVLSAFEPDSKP